MNSCKSWIKLPFVSGRVWLCLQRNHNQPLLCLLFYCTVAIYNKCRFCCYIAATLKSWHFSLARNPLEFSAMAASSWFLVRSNLRRCDGQRQGYRLTVMPLRRCHAAVLTAFVVSQIIGKHCSQSQSLLKWWVPSRLTWVLFCRAWTVGQCTDCTPFEETSLLCMAKWQIITAAHLRDNNGQIWNIATIVINFS